LLEERGVGIVNADDLNVSAPLRAPQKAADVPVNQTGNRQSKRLFANRRLLRGRVNQEEHGDQHN
jgi:hypothetical protein